MFVRRNVPLTGTHRAKPTNQDTHTGVRPSIVNSKPVISSGSRPLDNLFAHGGIPLGTSVAILEHGTTDFGSGVLKAFCAYGVAEKRSKQKTATIVVGIPGFCKSLPGVDEKYRESTQDPNADQQIKRKIAWRYRPSYEPETKPTAYAPNLNYRSAMLPRPSPQEITYVLGPSLAKIASELKATIDLLDQDTVCRIVVPNLLHPSIYPAQASNPKEIIPFLYILKQIVSSHRAVLILTLPLHLFPFDHPVTVHIQQLLETCVELEPFENDKVQGFINLLTLADHTARGIMVARKQEYAFKLSKTQFEVVEWAIPVEEGEGDKETEAW